MIGLAEIHLAAVTVHKSGPTDSVKTFESGWESCVLTGGGGCSRTVYLRSCLSNRDLGIDTSCQSLNVSPKHMLKSSPKSK